MPADVSQSRSAKQRIHNRMCQNVCIRMTGQACLMRNLHAAYDQFSAGLSRHAHQIRFRFSCLILPVFHDDLCTHNIIGYCDFKIVPAALHK
jgi:hypothetical protein